MSELRARPMRLRSVVGRTTCSHCSALRTPNTELGELAAAETTYERLLVLAPNNPVVLNNLAEVQLARGCATRAEGNAQKAMELVPSGSELDGAISDTREKAVAARAAGRDAPECDR